MGILDDARAATVTAEHLQRASAAGAEEHEDGDPNDPTPAMVFLCREFSGELAPVQVMAVMFRMEAMSRLILSQQAGGWTMEVRGERFTLVNEAAFEAAARAPLLGMDEGTEVTFDPETFARIALEYSEAEGSA